MNTSDNKLIAKKSTIQQSIVNEELKLIYCCDYSKAQAPRMIKILNKVLSEK